MLSLNIVGIQKKLIARSSVIQTFFHLVWDNHTVCHFVSLKSFTSTLKSLTSTSSSINLFLWSILSVPDCPSFPPFNNDFLNFRYMEKPKCKPSYLISFLFNVFLFTQTTCTQLRHTVTGKKCSINTFLLLVIFSWQKNDIEHEIICQCWKWDLGVSTVSFLNFWNVVYLSIGMQAKW